MIKVTIVIPNFNCSEFLNDCLSSILKQSFTNWECIIWDDGSTDNSLSIIKSFVELDRRFSYGWALNNNGLAATLNSAYALAQGEYICQVDADDILLPLALDTCVKFLDKNKKIDLVYTNKLIINENNTRFEQHWGNKEHYSKMKLFHSPPLVTHFRLMRREVYQRIGGYNEAILFGEDDDFAIRLAWGIHSNGKLVKPGIIKKINSICYLYRKRKNSLTDTIKVDVLMLINREYLKNKVLWSICAFWRLNTLYKQILWKIYLMEKGEI